MPSPLKFGFVFTILFILACVYCLLVNLVNLAIMFAVIGTFFALVTCIKPSYLSPLNRAWFELGILMGRIVSPIVLGAMFFLLITPVAVLLRLFGRDELQIKRRQVLSYWKVRSNNDKSSFMDQY